MHTTRASRSPRLAFRPFQRPNSCRNETKSLPILGCVLWRALLRMILKSLAIVEWFICYKDIISVLKRPETSSDLQKTKLWAVRIVTHSNSKCHASKQANNLERKKKAIKFRFCKQHPAYLYLLGFSKAVCSFLLTVNRQAWCITIHTFPISISGCRESRNLNIQTTVTQYDFNLNNPCILLSWRVKLNIYMSGFMKTVLKSPAPKTLISPGFL